MDSEMVQRGRSICQCLLVASSLAWLGCEQLAQRCEECKTLAVAPTPAPPLQITDSPTPAPTHPDRLPDKSPDEAPVELPKLLPPQKSTPATLPPAEALTPFTALRSLQRLAAERLEESPGYVARLRRREQVDGKQRPEEQILIKYRKEPAGIFMRWIGDEFKNREVLYVKTRNDDMTYIAAGNHDLKSLQNNGRPLAVRGDAATGMLKERYSVPETGIVALIERFGRMVDAAERGEKVGAVKFLGKVNRPEFDVALDGVLQIIPAGVDARLPYGGQRYWYFDTALRFPVLVIAHDAKGAEVEYYCFDRFLFPPQMADDDFNPAVFIRR